MKRVVLIGTWAAAAPIVVWIACEATGIKVETDSLFVFFIVVLATSFVMDFLDRRTADARIASGIAAGCTTIIVSGSGVEMFEDLASKSNNWVVYTKAPFVAAFAAQVLDLGAIHFALVMSICWDGEPGIPSRRRGRLPAHPD